MKNNFSMKVCTLEEDLYIYLTGKFDGSSAWQLANVILTRFHGQGKLFIDISKLSVVMPFGADMIVNLVPGYLIRGQSVFIRHQGKTHTSIDYFQTLVVNTIPESDERKFLSSTSIS